MTEIRTCFTSFLKAQRRRIRAFEEGVYELGDKEGFNCKDCGWKGLTAPMIDVEEVDVSEDEIVKCKECGSKNIKCYESKLEYYQNFGYSYSEFPEDIPPEKEEQYRIDN